MQSFAKAAVNEDFDYDLDLDRTDDRSRYNVDRIESHRLLRGKPQLLVYWEGYNEPTWEALEILYEDVESIVENYIDEQNLHDTWWGLAISDLRKDTGVDLEEENSTNTHTTTVQSQPPTIITNAFEELSTVTEADDASQILDQPQPSPDAVTDAAVLAPTTSRYPLRSKVNRVNFAQELPDELISSMESCFNVEVRQDDYNPEGMDPMHFLPAPDNWKQEL